MEKITILFLFLLYFFVVVRTCPENSNTSTLIEMMKQLNESVNAKLEVCLKENQKQQETNQYLEKKIENLRHLSAKRQTRREPMIAFTAYSDHIVSHIGIDQVIPYNHVVTNIGGAFNTHTHVFTCPVSGLYFFAFTVSEAYKRELAAKLVLDGQNIVDGIADSTDTVIDQQGVNFAVIQVKRGQAVHVSNYYNTDTELRSDDTYRFSSFSGYLLQRDDPTTEVIG